MERTCDSCGKPYDAKRPNSRFCGPACRVRASRGAVIDLPERPQTSSRTAAATREELDAVGMAESALGAACLALAERIDGGQDTGAGLASLVGRLAATLETAKRNGVLVADPVDDLAQRRIAKLRGA